MTGINHAVTITSIPPNGLTVQENMPVGTLLYTFTYQDVDPDIKTWSISYDDPTASQFFSLDPDSMFTSIVVQWLKAVYKF